MLAQLPHHTVAKKIENHEHLDLLWGKDVDKLVFPHIFEFLKTYAEPMDGKKVGECQGASLAGPIFSRILTDGTDRNHSKSHADVTGGKNGSRDELCADVMAGTSDEQDVSGSDSDDTMGDEKSSVVRTAISLADAATSELTHGPLASPASPLGKSTEIEDAGASGIETYSV